MKIIITLLCFCFSINLYSQNNKPSSKRYISLKSYHKKYKIPLTKQDTLNFIYKENDTLVLIKNYTKPKGVSVPYEYKDDNFLEFYTKIAFSNSQDNLKNKTTMKYWKDDIAIFFSKSIRKKTKKELIGFARDIVEHIDSIDVKVVKKVENSNYIVYYAGDFEYESRMHNYKNSEYYIYWNGKNQLYKQSVRINPNHHFNEATRLKILKEYFIKSLGQFNYNKSLSCDNFFSGCYQKETKLTDLDIELLKYHYSYGICKGTDLETFNKQHKKAKEVLKEHNTKNLFFHNEN